MFLPLKVKRRLAKIAATNGRGGINSWCICAFHSHGASSFPVSGRFIVKNISSPESKTKIDKDSSDKLKGRH